MCKPRSATFRAGAQAPSDRDRSSYRWLGFLDGSATAQIDVGLSYHGPDAGDPRDFAHRRFGRLVCRAGLQPALCNLDRRAVTPPQLAASFFGFHCGGAPSLTTVSPLRFRSAKKRPQLGGRTEAAISSNAFRRHARAVSTAMRSGLDRTNCPPRLAAFPRRPSLHHGEPQRASGPRMASNRTRRANHLEPPATACPALSEKIFLFFRNSKSRYMICHPAPHRGALRNVTNAGRGCGGRGRRA